MKKLILLLGAAFLSLTALADEGMWLLPYLQKMNIGDMRKEGCELTAEQIYSVNKGSLKDAIVIFGNGCTGEIVSGEGLLFTNHHCGYGNIQALSSVEHDYLKDGFWAMSGEEELPAPGLTATFIRRIVDVTADVSGDVPAALLGEEREKLVAERMKAVYEKLQQANPDMRINVQPFFGGNQYFAFVMEVYTDVRLVGTPPSSIGKFGGETDNWMWPRHTGDFSVFRVYAGSDNRPAEYSAENKPYSTENFLKISLDGYKPGDFAMIMGFPGSTQRFMTSYEIDEMLDVSGPQRVAIRGARQDILKVDMAASDRVRIQYASKYAQSSNYWKNTIGKMRGVRKLDVKGKKERQQEAFQAWADTETSPADGYSGALESIRLSVEGNLPYSAPMQYLNEVATAIEIIRPAMTVEEGVLAEEVAAAFYKDYNAPTDRKVTKKMLAMVRENLKPEDLPTVFVEVIDKDFGGNIDAYVDHLFNTSVFVDERKVLAADKEQITADPATVLGNSMVGKIWELYGRMGTGRKKYADGHRLYIAGLMKMEPDKAWAPDANFTIRLTYGQVLPYEPADGVEYNYYTTLRGVMEKENPESSEFVVPAKLKALYEAKDYGRYADGNGEMPVAFLANCDITGGNSGSPMMNGRGELIGLAFDGNWEAMSGDIAFEPDVQRTIGVDVRYVLFIIDKFGGAGWLLDEMAIVKHDGKKAKKNKKR